jgi:hypothetical protein
LSVKHVNSSSTCGHSSDERQSKFCSRFHRLPPRVWIKLVYLSAHPQGREAGQPAVARTTGLEFVVNLATVRAIE